MNLVRAELRRLHKRAFTRWMFAVVLIVLAVIAGSTWFTNQQTSPEVVAEAEQQAQEQYERTLQQHRDTIDQQIEECEQSQETGDRRFPEGFDCGSLADQEPRPEQFRAEWHLPPTFDFRDSFPRMITAFAALLGLFGFAAGASFVGAEWRTGGMMNLLLWRPRRLQVLGAKLGTLLGSLLAVGAVLGAVWTAVFWLVATYRGVTDTVTSGVWQSVALDWSRALALILAAGAVGFGLASLGRHTAMAMGVATGAVVVGVPGALIGAQIAGAAYPNAWVWVTYVRAWMEKTVQLRNFNACNYGMGGCSPEELVITWQAAGAGIAPLVVLLLLATMWHIRARDVT